MALLVINFLIESRRPLLGVITILPVVLVVLWVFGAMALTGISFNPVTAMIAAIAIGIAFIIAIGIAFVIIIATLVNSLAITVSVLSIGAFVCS